MKRMLKRKSVVTHSLRDRMGTSFLERHAYVVTKMNAFLINGRVLLSKFLSLFSVNVTSLSERKRHTEREANRVTLNIEVKERRMKKRREDRKRGSQ